MLTVARMTGRMASTLVCASFLVAVGCSDDPTVSTRTPTTPTTSNSEKNDASAAVAAAVAPVTATLDGVPLSFRKVEAYQHNGQMWATASNGVNEETPFNWESLTVVFPGAPGTYDCAARQNSVSYTTADKGKDYRAQGGAMTSCSIETLEVGPVGGKVRVKFHATLVHNNNEGGSDGSTHTTEGTFELVRGPDET